MFMIGPIGFVTPFFLLALLALPILWVLLRAIPPAPTRRRFPGVALLLGLRDDSVEAAKTPWWLLLLRTLAIGAAIVGFAGPVLNPAPKLPGNGPLLVVMDATWADAGDWQRRIARVQTLVADAERAGRPVALVRLTEPPEAPQFLAANALSARLPAVVPQPFAPRPLAEWIKVLPQTRFDTLWLADGLDYPDRAGFLAALQARGAVTLSQSPRPVMVLRPATFVDGLIQITADRLPARDAAEAEVIARGLDPAGIERELVRAKLTFAAGAARAETALSLPPELRNRITRFEIAGVRTAGAVSLGDDSLKRRKVALIGGTADREGLVLLSPTHYLRQALQPSAELIDGNLTDVVQASPDVIVLADIAQLSVKEADDLRIWVEKGGLLLRFSGPKLAAASVDSGTDDPLLPVQLRGGGRSLGGAMSWGAPKPLASFATGSPFYGLPVPPEVTISSQVLAQPGPELAARTIAALEDGTPLVTRSTLGQGQVVLFHITANAEWSNLPLSGLFMQMLERLAISTRPAAPKAADLAGQIFTPKQVLDAFGVASEADNLPGVAGEDLAGAIPGPALLPGVYAGEERRLALNVMGKATPFAAADWPSDMVIEGEQQAREQPLKGGFVALALLALMADILAALWLMGRFAGRLSGPALLVLALMLPQDARAQDAFAIEATSEVRLAYIVTGDKRLDTVSEAGLRGLGQRLYERTTIEPGLPMAVDFERDELAFFPFIYWPISADQPLPSAAAYGKLNQYLRNGGMILFDTRDGGISGGTSPESQRLQLIASALDIPPLEPIAGDHVLTRSFYLLQDFPGRFNAGAPWVESAPPDAEQAEGMPFRNLNDGVTPVVVGGNDWAAAWAVDENDAPMFPVGRGAAGDRQREIATRFGINLIMYVLTGNYKSDQVHVPALLERLGN